LRRIRQILNAVISSYGGLNVLFSCSDSFTEDSLRPNEIQDFLRKIMGKQDNRLFIMRGIKSIGDNVYQLIE
jgi:hypothetical protein